MKSNPLTPEEKQELAECEGIIRKNKDSFMETAEAILRVSDKQLYRETHGSFRAYIEEVHGISRERAYQLLRAAAIVKQVRTSVHTSADIIQMPTTEAQCRELAKVPAEQRAEVWQKSAENGQPTSVQIKETAEEMEKVRKGLKSVSAKPASSKIITRKQISEQALLDKITKEIFQFEETFPNPDSYEVLIADLKVHADRLNEHLEQLKTKTKAA